MSKILVQLYGNLSTLLAAGVPVLRALKTAQSGLPRRWVRILEDLLQRLRAGSTLSEAMSAHPRTFSVFDRMLVGVGEESGRLPEVLAELSEWTTFVRRVRSRFISLMIYPLFVLHFGSLIAPVPSVALSGMTVQGYIYSVLSILSGFYAPALFVLLLMKLSPSSGLVRLVMDSIVLRIPILGPGVYHYSLCRFAWAFSMMYSAGVPIVQCLRQSIKTVPNCRIRRMLEGSLKAASSGGAPSEGFSPKLPAEFLALWNVGEQTGDLDRTTAKLAQLHRERAEMWISALANILPWVIYGAIAAVLIYHIFVGFSAILGNIRTEYQNITG
jgi:type IV pilus assembly protein PilC